VFLVAVVVEVVFEQLSELCDFLESWLSSDFQRTVGIWLRQTNLHHFLQSLIVDQVLWILVKMMIVRVRLSRFELVSECHSAAMRFLGHF
jgi:hypothetical protein